MKHSPRQTEQEFDLALKMMFAAVIRLPYMQPLLALRDVLDVGVAGTETVLFRLANFSLSSTTV